MGDIGPIQQQYEVLPGEQFGIDDAADWTVPAPEPGPIPAPEPGPFPAPEPLPHPEPPR
jgi:hypothetical protein